MSPLYWWGVNTLERIKMATETKFGKGDKVSVEAEVHSVSTYDLTLTLKSGSGDHFYLRSKDVKLIKKATPPQPAAGSVIKVTDDYWGESTKYIVTKSGSLTHIDSYDGDTYKSSGSWDSLDHTNAKVEVLG